MYMNTYQFHGFAIMCLEFFKELLNHMFDGKLALRKFPGFDKKKN